MTLGLAPARRAIVGFFGDKTLNKIAGIRTAVHDARSAVRHRTEMTANNGAVSTKFLRTKGKGVASQIIVEAKSIYGTELSFRSRVQSLSRRHGTGMQSTGDR
jgi:hypothetical protein